MQRQTFISIIFIIFCCLTKSSLLACKCFLQTFQVESENADLILRGIVLNKKDSIASGKVFYTFRITNVWKGDTSQNITIETNYGGPACGSNFDINKEYVIFSSNLRTNRCRRNSEISTCVDLARLDFKYITLHRESIGKDTIPNLTKTESDYFNTIIRGVITHRDNSKNINFTDTKIAYFDHTFISKKEYFKRYGGVECVMYFEKFSNEEFNKTGGYFGVFIIKKKKYLNKRQKRKLLNQLF